MLKAAQTQFLKTKLRLNQVFGTESAEKEFEHLEESEEKIKDKKANKVVRDVENHNESNQNTTDDETIPKIKRTRKFRRKFLKTQPRRTRKRRKRISNVQTALGHAIDGWNGINKNISGEEVTDAEHSLSSKGQKFCPVELDPPVIRMQNELNKFFRLIRIKWAFRD